MNKQPWFKVGETVRLSLYGFDNLYEVSKVTELPNGRSNVKMYGYRLITCSDQKPLVYGEQGLNIFNESLLLKVPAETFLTFQELIHKINTTDYTAKWEPEDEE